MGIGPALARGVGSQRMVETVDTIPVIDTSPAYDVIGEHCIDPLRLLAIDADGHLVDLNLGTGDTSPTELSEFWRVDRRRAWRYRPDTDTVLPAPIIVVG